MPILGQETINEAEIMEDHSKILHTLEIFPLAFVTLKKEFYVRNRLQNKDILYPNAISAPNFLQKNPFLAGLSFLSREMKFFVLLSAEPLVFDLCVQGAAAGVKKQAGKCWNRLPKESGNPNAAQSTESCDSLGAETMSLHEGWGGAS